MFPIVDAMCDKVCVCVCHCASDAKKVPTAHANMFSIVDAVCDNVCVSLRFKCGEIANCTCEHVFDR